MGTICINPNIYISLTEESNCIIDPISEKIFHMNQVGALIMKKLQVGLSKQQLILEISEQFPSIPRKKVVEDAEDFICKMISMNVLYVGDFNE